MLDREEPYHLRNYIFDRGWLWHESHVVTPELMLELEKHVEAVIATALKQKLEALKGELPKKRCDGDPKTCKCTESSGNINEGFNACLAQITEIIDESIGEDV